MNILDNAIFQAPVLLLLIHWHIGPVAFLVAETNEMIERGEPGNRVANDVNIKWRLFIMLVEVDEVLMSNIHRWRRLCIDSCNRFLLLLVTFLRLCRFYDE